MGHRGVVLAVDDEPAMRRLIDLELSMHGYSVLTAASGGEALRIAEERGSDLLLLDLVLPDMSGLEVMRRFREKSRAPVILLTARDAEQDRRRGLQEGADDYMIKPFSAEELFARIEAVMRRGSKAGPGDQLLRAGDLEIGWRRRLVRKDGREVNLTRTEWALLECLAQRAGGVVPHGELLERVWGPEYRGELQYLRVWVFRLRSKLEPEPWNPRIINTWTGVGYSLEVTPLAEEHAS